MTNTWWTHIYTNYQSTGLLSRLPRANHTRSWDFGCLLCTHASATDSPFPSALGLSQVIRPLDVPFYPTFTLLFTQLSPTWVPNLTISTLLCRDENMHLHLWTEPFSHRTLYLSLTWYLVWFMYVCMYWRWNSRPAYWATSPGLVKLFFKFWHRVSLSCPILTQICDLPSSASLRTGSSWGELLCSPRHHQGVAKHLGSEQALNQCWLTDQRGNHFPFSCVHMSNYMLTDTQKWVKL